MLNKLGRILLVAILVFGVGEIAARLFLPVPPNPGHEPLLRFQRHQDLGFFHAPSQQGYLDDGLATINAMGLRGELPEVPKPPDSFRILAIGDSATFGWGVNDDETYVIRLEQQLRETFPQLHPRVINAGVSAYDTNREVRLLKHFWSDLKPDLVLVGFIWTDLPFQTTAPDGDPNSVTAQVKGTNYHVGNPGATFNIGSTKSRVNRVLRQSRLLFAARHAWLSLTAGTSMAKNELRWETALLEGRETPAIERAWQTVRDALAEIRNLAQPAGVPVGVVIMPVPPQVASDRPQAKYQSRIREIAGSLGLFVVDPLPLFEDHRHDPKLFIPYDRLHTDSHGQQLIADAVFDTLKQQAPFRK